MHQLLTQICAELDQLVGAVGAIGDDRPFSVAHNNWSFPGVTRKELARFASDLALDLKSRGKDDLGAVEGSLADWPGRLGFLRQQTIGQMWANAGIAVPTYFATLYALQRATEPALVSEAETKGIATQSAKDIVRTARSVRGLAAQLEALQPKTNNLTEMIKRIEDAFETADQLPIELAALGEAKAQIVVHGENATTQLAQIVSQNAEAEKILKILAKSKEEARETLRLCEEAYSAATTQGLAAAFDARAKELGRTVWTWSVVLIVTLGGGSYLGYLRLSDLAAIARDPNVSGGALFLNFALSFFTVGAPIWIGWLATKQIGQRFRLQEDYAFKASVSKAYDGYRKQAARVDKDLEAKLLASALKRLDEEPLRHVEQSNHGSPFHEALESKLISKVVSIVARDGRKAEEEKSQAGAAQ